MSITTPAEPYPMRAPCPHCGETSGTITPNNGQQVVRCNGCDRGLYNAPKTETGHAIRSVTTIHNGIKPKQRARILARANGQCETCGSRTNLHVGHIISVDAGMNVGLTEDLLNDDDNLYATCEQCNLGQGREALPLRLALAIFMRRVMDVR